MNKTFELNEIETLTKLCDGKQTAYAMELIAELMSFIPDLSNELTPELMLDALGCAGLSLVTYDSASLEFIQGLK